MKILYIAQDCSPTYGSECRVGFGIISTMAKLGHDITVITNNGCIPPFEDYIKKNNIANIKFLGIERKRIFLTKFGYHGAMHKEFKNKALKIAVELNKKEHFDIIHHLTPIGPTIILGPLILQYLLSEENIIGVK